MFRSSALPFTLLLLLAPPARSNTIVVSPTGSFPTIQFGVDAALAGDTVAIQDGTYRENIVVPAGKNGLHLLAAGKVIVEARKAAGAGGGPGLTIQSDGVLVKGLSIRNAKENAQGNDNGDGIRILANSVTLQSCSILGSETHGIFIGGDGAKLKSCTIEACEIGARAVDASNLVVSKCAVNGSSRSAFEIQNCPAATFTKCSFNSFGDPGAIVTTQVASDGVVVKQCTFTCGERDGVSLLGSGASVLACTFTDTSGGIGINGANVTVENCTFVRLRDDAAAVSLVNSNGSRVEDNSMTDVSDLAVFVRTALDVVVRGNTVKRGGFEFEPGFEADDDASVEFEDNSVLDSGAGFEIHGPDCVLRHNLAKRSIRDGYFVQALATGALIDGNVADRCAAEGLDHRGAGSTIRNNVLKKCRLDLTNDGTAVFQNNDFKTGGTNVPGEID